LKSEEITYLSTREALYIQLDSLLRSCTLTQESATSQLMQRTWSSIRLILNWLQEILGGAKKRPEHLHRYSAEQSKWISTKAFM